MTPRRKEIRIGENGSKNKNDPSKAFQVIDTFFEEPIYKIINKIKDDPFIKWSKKMDNDLTKRNNVLRCTFYKE